MKRRQWKGRPKSARRISKYQDIKRLEDAAKRRGESVDGRYYAMCHSKVRYRTEAEAAPRLYNGLLVTYKCDYCVYYHNGRPPGQHSFKAKLQTTV